MIQGAVVHFFIGHGDTIAWDLHQRSNGENHKLNELLNLLPDQKPNVEREDESLWLRGEDKYSIRSEYQVLVKLAAQQHTVKVRDFPVHKISIKAVPFKVTSRIEFGENYRGTSPTNGQINFQ